HPRNSCSHSPWKRESNTRLLLWRPMSKQRTNTMTWNLMHCSPCLHPEGRVLLLLTRWPGSEQLQEEASITIHEARSLSPTNMLSDKGRDTSTSFFVSFSNSSSLRCRLSRSSELCSCRRCQETPSAYTPGPTLGPRLFSKCLRR
ncbi:Hypothetical protein, putative, partial [Bodo saltans]